MSNSGSNGNGGSSSGNSGKGGGSQGNQGQGGKTTQQQLTSYESSVANLFPGATIVKNGQVVRKP